MHESSYSLLFLQPSNCIDYKLSYVTCAWLVIYTKTCAVNILHGSSFLLSKTSSASIDDSSRAGDHSREQNSNHQRPSSVFFEKVILTVNLSFHLPLYLQFELEFVLFCLIVTVH